MIGLFRSILALMVMAYHILKAPLPMGTYSVFGFYVISGFLMTFIMHENYGYTNRGRVTFFANRFLRLYPLYWTAAIISIVVIYYIGPSITTRFNVNLYLPNSFEMIIQNIFIFFAPLSPERILDNLISVILSWRPSDIQPRLVPPSWALTVEIFFYILICLGLSKTIIRVRLWMIVSIVYVIATFMLDGKWQHRYFTFAAASLPFSIGSLVYFLYRNNRFHEIYQKSKLSSGILFIIFLINCFTCSALFKSNIAGHILEIIFYFGLYLNILICALLVYSLIKSDKIIKISKNFDKFIGDFSYPMYLLHFQVGVLAAFLLYGPALQDKSSNGWSTFSLALAIVLLLSLSFKYLIEKPVENIRNKIKTRNIQP